MNPVSGNDLTFDYVKLLDNYFNLFLRKGLKEILNQKGFNSKDFQLMNNKMIFEKFVRLKQCSF